MTQRAARTLGLLYIYFPTQVSTLGLLKANVFAGGLARESLSSSFNDPCSPGWDVEPSMDCLSGVRELQVRSPTLHKLGGRASL